MMLTQIVITLLIFHVLGGDSQHYKDAGNCNDGSSTFARQTTYGATQEQGSRLKLLLRRVAKVAMTDENTKPTTSARLSSSGSQSKTETNIKETTDSPEKNVTLGYENKGGEENKIKENSTEAPSGSNATAAVDKTGMNITDEEFPDRVGKPVIITLQGR